MIFDQDFVVSAAAHGFINRSGHAVIPPSDIVVIVAANQATRLYFREIQLQILLHEFVLMVSVNVNPIEVTIWEVHGALCRAVAVNFDGRKVAAKFVTTD